MSIRRGLHHATQKSAWLPTIYPEKVQLCQATLHALRIAEIILEFTRKTYYKCLKAKLWQIINMHGQSTRMRERLKISGFIFTDRLQNSNITPHETQHRPFIRLHHNTSTINQHQSGLNSERKGNYTCDASKRVICKQGGKYQDFLPERQPALSYARDDWVDLEAARAELRSCLWNTKPRPSCY